MNGWARSFRIVVVSKDVPLKRAGLFAAVATLPVWMIFSASARGDEAPGPKDALSSARKLLLTGKYAEAVEEYASLAKADPVGAAVGKSHALAAQGHYEEAAGALAEAAKSHSKDARPPAELARLAFDRGDYAAADRHAAAALKADPNQLLARWIAAERLRTDGKLDQALTGYEWFVDFYNDHEVNDPDSLRWIGLAAAQFARWKRLSDQFSFLVNDLYPEAAKADPQYWPADYETGLLFLEKFNEAEAKRALGAALAKNPAAAEVYAALARLAIQNFDLDEAGRALDRAREINPRLLELQLYQADMELANFRTREAIDVLETALEINPRSEQAAGRLAAAYTRLEGWPTKDPKSRAAQLIDEAIRRNPHCGEFFQSLAAALDLTRHYPSAAHYYQQAIEHMPQLIETRGALGLLHMRLGEEVKAREQLEASFADDPFNVRVSNSLKVLDVLAGYAVLETEHFVIKFDRAKDALLAKYAAQYLEEQVYPALTRQFQFQPQDKSLFEIFQRARNTSGHGWFSARMVGLPYVGTVGACAGKMVALASPGDMPQKYNWSRVLKHEFVHVLNLQQTNFNIPHWYTEALAVENEGYPRPLQWDKLLRERVPAGKLYNLDNLNLAFVRPHSSDDWAMAYCQAQLYAQYMLKTYGPGSLAKMLTCYADNLDTRRALERSFGVRQEDFERGYLSFVREIVAGLAKGSSQEAEAKLGELIRAHEAKPDDADAAARLARAYLDRKEYPAARKLAAETLKKQPKHAGAAYVLARVRLVIGEEDEALELLEKCLDSDEPDTRVLALLAALRLKREEFDEAARLYELGAKRQPGEMQWTKSLARLYLKSGEKQKLVPLLKTLAEHDADDVLVRKKLAQLALARNDYAQAAHWALDVLYIDVSDAEMHHVRGQALVEQKKLHDGLEEYRAAIELDPKQPSWRLELADALVEAKRPDEAREVLEKLLKTTPDFPAARQMLETLGKP